MENEEDPVEESAYEHSHSAMEEGEEQEADHLHIKHNKRKYEMNVEIPAVLGGNDNTAAFIAAMSNRNNNDGFGGGGALGLVALLALLGNRGGLGGFGNDVNVGGGLQSSVDTNAILQSLGDIKAAVPLAEANVQLALAGQAASITGQINSGTFATLESLGTTRAALSAQTQALTQQIAEVGNQADRNLYQLSVAINNDGAQTRALIQSIDKQNDSRLITAQANEIVELRNERNRSEDRHGIEITMTNNQNQVAMQFQQQAQVMGQLANALCEVGQLARATNTNLIVGNSGATTTGPQTSNPVNVRA